MWWRERRLALDDMWRFRRMIPVLLGVLMIPLVYSCLYLWAFFDPYSFMQDLPVAVVNEDRGTKWEGEEVYVGEDLVEQLMEDDHLQWHLVSRKEMEHGLEKNRYYLAVVIPENFSKRVASIQDPDPKQAGLKYKVNPGHNYLSAQMGDRIVQDLERRVAIHFTHAYVEGLFDKLADSAADLDEAADGARSLADATKQAADATGEVDRGAGQLADGVRTLNQSLHQLWMGSQRLVLGLERSSQGSSQLAAGVQKMDESLQLMKEETLLAKGKIPQLQEGAERVQGGIEAIRQLLSDPNLTRRAERISTLAQEIQQHHKKADEARQQLLERHPELADSPEMRQLEEALAGSAALDGKAIVEEASQLNQQWKQAQKNIDALAEGQGRVVDGIAGVAAGFERQGEALNRLTQGSATLQKQMERLVDGQKNLLDGAHALENGLSRAAQAPTGLSEGMGRLQTGIKELQSGLFRIGDGQGTLADRLGEGVQKAWDQLRDSDAKADQMADPLKVNKESIHPVPNYATGFAPYFIALSLWVGAMILFTVIDLKRPLLDDQRPLSIPSALAMGSLQALLLVTALMWLVGIRPWSAGALLALAVLTSVAFIAINHMLVGLLGDVGRFLAIVILMLQLAASGGTYPVELLPQILREIHPWLPMTHAIEGLRSAISIGNPELLWRSAGVLLLYAAGAYTLRAAVMGVIAWRKRQRFESPSTA
ncbi:YhgE/Pip domain-containing protein [Desmospora profundinema]|uniref:Membrane protein n=1 Tax=Desmospora profundinema TaxID=1571184 RepID=A0ABU1IKW8_9BACL|nr:YhgE/Pip domain-containing protein [Desmospora profundinema]MDR6225336.1 putative membrane protein [Desmospora profundinema]